jgi:hypothetical protein
LQQAVDIEDCDHPRAPLDPAGTLPKSGPVRPATKGFG